ncbi:hypothetical protein HDU97_006990 [Phlyctochytrium planicorne]|nr:hypothetical protein HDU97_006990 [Phlyctochytrium planicorne]
MSEHQGGHGGDHKGAGHGERRPSKIPAEEVHVEVKEEIDAELERLLQTDPRKGLTTAEVHERLEKFGRNEIPEKKVNPVLKFLSYFWNPIAVLLELAAIIAGVVHDWIDVGILLFVLIVNAIIGFSEEARAENALDALKNTLALKCRSWRNGELTEVEAKELVPGDIIALRLGDIVPADCRLLGLGVTGEATEGLLQIDQSALTGESLPVNKKKDDLAYSSSTVKQGQMLGVVTKTGAKTYIGRAATLMGSSHEEGHFQKVVNNIGNFLIIISVVMVIIIFLEEVFRRGRPPLEALNTVLVLTIAAIPVGLQTVMSVTMAVGSKQLAKKQVICKRLTAIEELASVSILCSDKTGTLTLNELSFDKPYLAKKNSTNSNLQGNGESYTSEELLLHAYFASEPGAMDAIELAVRRAAEDTLTILHENKVNKASHEVPGFKQVSFVPFSPDTKYTEATIMNLTTGETFRCVKGAPHVIVHIVNGHDEATKAVLGLAKRGLRALGVARTVDKEMTKFEMVGMISLLDPPRPDSAQTILECAELGIAVKMITGDQLIIAKEVAQRLGMNRTILSAHKLVEKDMTEEQQIDRVIKADGFAEVIPEHKHRVVDLLQKRGFLVGMTGDGVNDAPALKKANVGIAVHGCTDAARSASDIVLLAPGLSTIVDGVKCSRAIFQRMRSYAIYRITSTIHFLMFFFIAILWFNFTLPDRLIILIAVLNDAATLVISVDNAKISKKPDKWRLGQLLTLSVVLGFLLMLISFAHLLIARDVFKVSQRQLETIMYLQISSCPHFVIFSTRLTGWFWENMPSISFMIAVVATQIIAMFMSIYGVEALETYEIGWGWGVSVICISLLSFMVLDIVKVLIIRHWSFEMTAKLWPTPSRVGKLKKRKEQMAVKERTDKNFAKVRKVVDMVKVVNTMQKTKPANVGGGGAAVASSSAAGLVQAAGHYVNLDSENNSGEHEEEPDTDVVNVE